VNFATFTQQLGVTNANGELTVPNVIGGRNFTVRAYDPPQFSDYREVVSQLTGEGQILTVPIVLRTVGSLTGHVTYADGTPAAGATVLIITRVPFTIVSATTDASGAYAVLAVPIGDFRMSARDFNSRSGASFSGRLQSHGDAITADIALTDVVLPATLRDANGFDYRAYLTGQLTGSGLNSGNGFPDSFQLAVGPTGAVASFPGNNLATPDMAGRQLTIQDFGGGVEIAPRVENGVRVTRKLYVPDSGYFARFLEIVENPGSTPISVDLQLQSTFNSTRVVSTSSGDNVFTTADQWVVADAPAYPLSPAVAHVMAGAGGALALGDVQSNLFFVVVPVERWNGIVVPAGGRAIIMHFAVQEPNASAAQSAAERLVQLPPEAIEGLTTEERQAIVNFAVPADGSSPIAPFAVLAGTVRGADGVTRVGGAKVAVAGSLAAMFKQPITVMTDADGRYRANTLGVGPFTVQAIDSVTGTTSPIVSGVVDATAAPVTADLTFTGAGALRGTVRFAPRDGRRTWDVVQHSHRIDHRRRCLAERRGADCRERDVLHWRDPAWHVHRAVGGLVHRAVRAAALCHGDRRRHRR
jgi:carboxypeptidase family protein